MLPLSSPPTAVYRAYAPSSRTRRRCIRLFAHCARFPTAASRRSPARVSVPVWLTTLSGQLPVVGLVGRYPTNYLIGRRPILSRVAPLIGGNFPHRPHLPLAPVSRGYCRAEGRLPTRYSPVRQWQQQITPLLPLDLHVLGTPPAFVLSQDQTLRHITG